MLLTRAAEMMYFCWNYFQAMWYGSLWNMVPQLLGPTESTVMVFCAVIGTGTVFFIDVKLSEMVHEVKRLIKKEKPHLINFDSSLLRLYLAREDDAWMDSRDEATMEALKTEPVPERIAALIQQELILFQYKCLNEIACFSSNFQQSNHNIHVLVQLPDEPEKVTQHKRIICLLGWVEWALGAILAVILGTIVYCGYSEKGKYCSIAKNAGVGVLIGLLITLVGRLKSDHEKEMKSVYRREGYDSIP